MEVTTQEILAVLDKLLESLGLQLEEYDFVFLTQAELYVEMFKLMFPTLGPMLEIDFSAEEINDEEIIQSLIDFLSQYIIKVDLDHISSELITQGDPKSILNFIQLLYEINKTLIQGEGESEGAEEGQSGQGASGAKGDKQVKSSPNSFKQLSEYSQRSSDAEYQNVKYHTAQGIPEEFEDQMVQEESGDGEHIEGEEDPSEEEIANMLRKQAQKGMKKELMHDNAYDYNPPQRRQESHESYSGSRISEVSKSKEFSDYEMNTKKKSGVGRRSADIPSDGDFERQRNIEALKWNRRGQEEEEQAVEEEDEGHMGEAQSDQYISIREGSGRNQKMASHLEGEEEDYDDQEIEYVDDYEDEDIHHPTGAESRKGEHSEDIDYYASDPINYGKMGDKLREQERTEEEEEQVEESKGGESEQVEEEEEHEGVEYDYGDQASGVEELSHTESDRNQLEPNYESREEEQQRVQYYDPREMQQQRESLKKARPQTAKSYKTGEVQYRPLRPVTGNIVRFSEPKKKTGTKKTQKKKKVTSQLKHERSYQENQEVRSRGSHQESSRPSQREGGSRRGEESQQGSEHSQTGYRPEFDEFARQQAEMQRRQMTQKRLSTKRVKPVTIKGESLKAIYEMQQGRLYDRMRDEKLDYLKKIHKIIYQLDKKKIIEDKKAYLDHRRSMDEETINMMITIKQNYREKMDMLRQGHIGEKNERKMTDFTQKLFLKTLKQELNFDQMKELERLRNRWENERIRFEMMTMDENFLEKKLVDLYRK